jgi:hypothetical protein
MLTFSRTHLPDSIVSNGKVYTRDTEKTDALQDGKPFDQKGSIKVLVLSKNLRGKEDLHNKPYKPTKWIYSHN